MYENTNIVAPFYEWGLTVSRPEPLRGGSLHFILYTHCVKSIHIRSYSDLHFPAFGLNTEREILYLSVFSPNAGKCRPE